MNAPAAPALEAGREQGGDHPVDGLRRRREGSRARGGERSRLLERYHRHGAQAAREAVVQRILPLAHQPARRYQGGSEPLEDLVQVASVGLLKAIDRFDLDLDRVTAFSCSPCSHARRDQAPPPDKAWSVRPPRDLQDLTVRLDRT